MEKSLDDFHGSFLERHAIKLDDLEKNPHASRRTVKFDKEKNTLNKQQIPSFKEINFLQPRVKREKGSPKVIDATSSKPKPEPPCKSLEVVTPFSNITTADTSLRK